MRFRKFLTKACVIMVAAVLVFAGTMVLPQMQPAAYPQPVYTQPVYAFSSATGPVQCETSSHIELSSPVHGVKPRSGSGLGQLCAAQ